MARRTRIGKGFVYQSEVMKMARRTRIGKGFVYLVRYADDETIEGYAKTKKDFLEWLRVHNKDRRAECEPIEHADDFELLEIEELNKNTEVPYGEGL